MFCKCGCYGVTRGGRFLPGHDAKLKSRLLQEARAGSEWATNELIRLFPRLYPTRESILVIAPRSGAMGRTFGVELEVILPSGYSHSELAEALRNAGVKAAYEGYNHTTRKHWKVTTDSSLRGNSYGEMGAEIVSPILRGEAGFRAIKKVCAVLAELGVKVNKTCGLHVHHGARDLTGPTAHNLIRCYRDQQDAINTILAPSRRDGNHYCAQINDWDVRGTAHATTVEQVANGIGTRYKVVNLTAFASRGTVEFRQMQGSTDATKIINWVKLTQKMVEESINGDWTFFGIVPQGMAGWVAQRQLELAA